MLGTIGHLAILLGWVACGLSIFAYFQTAQTESIVWRRVGRSSWYVTGAASLAASGILMHLIMSHQFQYAYVYSNTSLDLPTEIGRASCRERVESSVGAEGGTKKIT